MEYMTEEEDPVDLFQRAADVALAIKRDGPSPVLLIAKMNLELALKNHEEALKAASELAAMADNEVGREDARRVIVYCQKVLDRKNKGRPEDGVP